MPGTTRANPERLFASAVSSEIEGKNLIHERSTGEIKRNLAALSGVLQIEFIEVATPVFAMTSLAEENMRRCVLLLVIALAAGLSQGQTQAPAMPPQTARQALLEMFLGKTPDAFKKHLPQMASKALIHQSDDAASSIVQQISMIGRQLTAQGHLETFDEGATLLVSEQDEGQRKIRTEVIVEHDSLAGENDEIELSIHVYRDGQPDFLPVIPRLIFTMTQEDGIWRLAEATLAAHIPLTDPDYLKGVRKKQDETNENMAAMRVRKLAAVELRFAAQHPERGFSCNFANIAATPDQGDATTETSAAASNESAGYHFAISGCSGTPASKFQITAVPLESDSEMKAFCADESGKLRFDAHGKAAACLSQGQVVDQPQADVADSAD